MTEFFDFADGDLSVEEREKGLALLAKCFTAARKIAFLTGAGASTESGIPDFRSSTGIYNTTSEEIFSIDFFNADPERFYSFFADFYRGIVEARPNAGHLAIADDTVSISVEAVKGVKNVLFGGEGLFNTVLTGPGKVTLQTMPLSSFAAATAGMLKKGN